jgi:hypothetical protein
VMERIVAIGGLSPKIAWNPVCMCRTKRKKKDKQ